MKKLILSAAMGASVLLLSACGDGAEEADTATAEAETADTAATTTADAGTTAGGDWVAGTRIVEEGGTTYRVAPDGTRTAIEGGEWRIVTEGDQRYRVDTTGTRVRIDEQGVDVDGPDVEGVDVDLDTNSKGNLDVDVSTDGTDASQDH